MSEESFTFLVPVDDSVGLKAALCYAARRAREVAGCVALLAVVEANEIETWGGVERAMADEAFDQARKTMVQYEALVKEILGREPKTFYYKGERRAVLLDLIEKEKDIAVLVLPALGNEGLRHPLVAELTTDKGLKKLSIPLVIVPSEPRCDDCVSHQG